MARRTAEGIPQDSRARRRSTRHQLPGVLVYGDTREAALRRAKALALETIAGLAELGETEIDDAIHFDAA